MDRMDEALDELNAFLELDFKRDGDDLVMSRADRFLEKEKLARAAEAAETDSQDKPSAPQEPESGQTGAVTPESPTNSEGLPSLVDEEVVVDDTAGKTGQPLVASEPDGPRKPTRPLNPAPKRVVVPAEECESTSESDDDQIALDAEELFEEDGTTMGGSKKTITQVVQEQTAGIARQLNAQYKMLVELKERAASTEGKMDLIIKAINKLAAAGRLSPDAALIPQPDVIRDLERQVEQLKIQLTAAEEGRLKMPMVSSPQTGQPPEQVAQNAPEGYDPKQCLIPLGKKKDEASKEAEVSSHPELAHEPEEAVSSPKKKLRISKAPPETRSASASPDRPPKKSKKKVKSKEYVESSESSESEEEQRGRSRERKERYHHHETHQKSRRRNKSSRRSPERSPSPRRSRDYSRSRRGREPTRGYSPRRRSASPPRSKRSPTREETQGKPAASSRTDLEKSVTPTKPLKSALAAPRTHLPPRSEPAGQMETAAVPRQPAPSAGPFVSAEQNQVMAPQQFGQPYSSIFPQMYLQQPMSFGNQMMMTAPGHFQQQPQMLQFAQQSAWPPGQAFANSPQIQAAPSVPPSMQQ